jgi:hypothetical protein
MIVDYAKPKIRKEGVISQGGKGSEKWVLLIAGLTLLVQKCRACRAWAVFALASLGASTSEAHSHIIWVPAFDIAVTYPAVPSPISCTVYLPSSGGGRSRSWHVTYRFHPLWDKILSQSLQTVADRGCHLEGSSPYKGTAHRGVYWTCKMESYTYEVVHTIQCVLLVLILTRDLCLAKPVCIFS